MSEQFFFYNDSTGCLRKLKAYAKPLKALEEFRDVNSASIFCFCLEVTKNHRQLLVCFEATATLRAFARACALDVLHLWEAPAAVKEYLETGNEALRDAAGAAAWDAARAAAGAAARAAARDAAGAAAEAAARDAAWAAGDAAWDAAGATGAAGAKLAPTVKELQQSALSLLIRMIEAKD